MIRPKDSPNGSPSDLKKKTNRSDKQQTAFDRTIKRRLLFVATILSLKELQLK